MVLHRLNGQVNTSHVTNLARPQTTTIHNVLRIDRTFRGNNIPGPIGNLSHIGRTAMGEILCPMHLSRLGKSIGGSGRVKMAVLRIPKHCVVMVRINQWMTFGQLFW